MIPSHMSAEVVGRLLGWRYRRGRGLVVPVRSGGGTAWLAAAGVACVITCLQAFSLAGVAMAQGSDPLVVHYTFDDAGQFTGSAGDSILDSSGNGLNGTEASSITWSGSGISGGAMTTTTSSYFTTDLSSAGIAGDSFTISFWAKTGATSGGYSYNDWGKVDFSNGTTTQTAELRSLPNPSGFYWRDTSLPFIKTTPGSPVNLKDNTWHMVTVTANPATDDMVVYLDGTNATTFTGYPRGSDFSLSNLWIGRGSFGGLPGLMDDVQLYSSPLSAADVATMYANPGLAATGASTWSPSATGNAWLASGNWSSAASSAVPGEVGNATSTNNRLAIFGDYSGSSIPQDGLGINMASAVDANTGQGVVALGGIQVNSNSGTLRIGNSDSFTSGTLRLNGATSGGVVGTVVDVRGGSDLVIADSPDGYFSGGMTVELAASESRVAVASGRLVTIDSAIREATAGSNLTLDGGGTLVLGAANTISSLTVNDGVLVAAADGALGSGTLTLDGGTLRHAASSGLSNAITLSGDATSNTIDFGAQMVDFLVVGGGGGAGGGVSGQSYDGGGGGGEVLFGSSLTAISSDVTVGAGGGLRADGEASVFGVVTASGGGSGMVSGIGGTSGSGFAGGAKGGYEGGGGGGAGGVGSNGIASPREGGDGGVGLASSITGTEVYYGGGGAGGGGGEGPGSGGLGGGAGVNTPNGQPLANSGGGGMGGGVGGYASTAGADGVVIVRYEGGPAATGGTIDSTTVSGYTLHTFTSGSDQLVFSPKSVTLSGDISGSGGFTFDSVGTLTLSGSNSYSGGTIVAQGTLATGSATAVGTGGVTVRSGATLAVNHADVLQSADLVAEAGSTVSLAAPAANSYTIGSIAGAAAVDAGVASLNVGGSNASTEYGGDITAGTLVKQGSGTLKLTGSNSFGGVTLSGGSLVAASAGALGSAAVTVNGGEFKAYGGTTVANNLQLTATTTLGVAPVAVEYLIVGGGGGGGPTSSDYAAGGGGGEVLVGSVDVAAGSTTITVGGGGAYLSDGEASSAFGLTANPGLAGRNDSSTGFNSVGGASGSGFDGGSGYDGGGGGGAGGPGANEDSIGSRLAGIGGDGVFSSITGTEVGYGGGGAGRFEAGWGPDPRGGQNYGGGGPGEDGADNTGGGGGGTAGGSGIVVVRYAGSAMATGGAVDTSSVPGYTVHAFTDLGEADFVITPSATMSGVLSGTGGVNYDSAGVMVLSGDNTYSGGTVVSRGTLRIDGDNSAASGAVSVAAGAVFGGNGIVGGATTIGGLHAPGASPGLQTFVNGLTYEADATLLWELSANTAASVDRGVLYDAIDLTTAGTLEVDSAATLDLVFDAALDDGTASTVDWTNAFWDKDQQWTLASVSSPVSWDGSLFGTLTVGVDSLGLVLESVRPDASFSLVASDGDMMLEYSAVPEPAGIVMVGLAAALVMLRRRGG